jgi:hypothetical protein
MNNRVITIQNTNDVKSLIENSTINLDLTMPNLYLNYLKIIAYPNNYNENYARPYIDSNLFNYEAFNEDEENEYELKIGKHILLVYPDTILTKEMLNFNKKVGSSALITTIFDYDCDSKTVRMLGKKRIENENVELYRNITTFLQFSKPIKTKTAFKECAFKPLVFDNNKIYGDIRMIPFFKELEKSEIEYKLINETNMLRYVTKLESLDFICTINSKTIDFPLDNNENSYFNQMLMLVNEVKSENEIKQISGMNVRLLTLLLKQMSLVNLLKFSQIPVVPCLVIKYDIKEAVSVKISTKMEIFKYNDSINNYNIIDQDWLPLVKIVIKIFKICYFLNSEEILNMLIKNNGISVNITSEKDRIFLKNVVSHKQFNKILSILVQIWQYSKDKTKIE